MAKQSASEDRNFDDLAGRFKKNIYGGLKGSIRLAVLDRDFTLHLPDLILSTANTRKLRILDAGGGQGQFSIRFAQAGHDVVICDISAEMLKLAKTEINALGLQERVMLIHGALQTLPMHLDNCEFDVVLCHAVMEWMAEPQTLLPCLYSYLKPEGYLSLTFYNRHSLIYKNLLRTNYKKIIEQDFNGDRGSLTPIHPIDPAVVTEWINDLSLVILSTSGIRVFHDYILDSQMREREPEQLIALELQFSQQEPYRSLGRYIHILAQKITVNK